MKERGEILLEEPALTKTEECLLEMGAQAHYIWTIPGGGRA